MGVQGRPHQSPRTACEIPVAAKAFTQVGRHIHSETSHEVHDQSSSGAGKEGGREVGLGFRLCHSEREAARSEDMSCLAQSKDKEMRPDIEIEDWKPYLTGHGTYPYLKDKVPTHVCLP